MAEQTTASGFCELPLLIWHADALARSPLDPFDRMLIAQAVVEGLTLVGDQAMAAYDVPIMTT